MCKTEMKDRRINLFYKNRLIQFSMEIVDPQEYNQHFAEKSQQIRQGPVPNSQRSCTDVVCLIIFVLIILTTLILGAIMINDGRTFYEKTWTGSQTNISGFATVFSTQGGIIVGMFFFSLVLSIAFMLLLKAFPKCVVYTMITMIYLVFGALIVFGIINAIWWMVITFAVSLLVISCMLFCFRRDIQTGIVLLKVSATFLTEKPSVYAAPLYPLLWGIIFFIFWICAMVGEVYSLSVKMDQAKTDPNVSTSKQNAFITVWVIFFVFMVQFLYYVQTYLIATSCGLWYYGIQQNYCTKGVWRLNRYHIGSLTFAAVLITIITILRMIVNSEFNRQRSEGNIAATICLCLVKCCISCIESLLQTLNHNAIIVMTVTGQNYFNSAKTALSIIFQNFGLFNIVSFISSLVSFLGTLIVVGIPTLTGFLIVKYGRGADASSASFTAIVVCFLSVMVSYFIITMITEALSCVFIFYCFDKKFRSMGITVSNSPDAIREFDGYSSFNSPHPGAPTTDQHLKQRNQYF